MIDLNFFLKTNKRETILSFLKRKMKLSLNRRKYIQIE